MKFFVAQKQSQNNSNSNFFKVCIHNTERIFLEKYSQILPLNEEFGFYTKSGRATTKQINKYNHFNKKRFYIILDEEFHQKYLELMHTFFMNEFNHKNVSNYSVNFFFYDMFNIIKENIKNLENIEQFK